MIISRGDAARVTNLSPHDAAAMVQRGEAVLVDVREADEIDRERIDGADAAPLSSFDPSSIRARYAGVIPIFQCRVGQRSIAAALAYGHEGEDLYHLAGGIEAWKHAGLTVVGRR